MLLLVFVLIPVSILVYMIWAPFYIEIDSNAGIYRLRLHRLVALSLCTEPEPAVVTKFAWWTWRHPFRSDRSEKKKAARKKPSGQRRKIPFRAIFAAIRSFRIKKCRVNIDLGDMQLNGLAFPFFSWLGWYFRRPIRVNFTGVNEIVIQLQNNLARMSWAWLSSIIKSKRRSMSRR